jgi:transcriptional regulator with XRE-family HTH domain
MARVMTDIIPIVKERNQVRTVTPRRLVLLNPEAPMATDVLAHFLRSRRARLRPGAGEPGFSQSRRVPGLRREEVAERAGISTSWYTLLEQGHRTDISSDALTAIAGALQLNSHEMVYLFTVSKETVPADRIFALGNDIGHADALESIARTDYMLCYDDAGTLVDATEGVVLIANFGSRRDARGELFYRRLFTDPRLQQRYARWEEQADHAVAVLRFFAATHDHMPALLADLMALPAFHERWIRHDVHSDIGWRPENTIFIPGDDEAIDVKSFGLLVPGGGRMIYYFGAGPDDERRMRALSGQARGEIAGRASP